MISGRIGTELPVTHAGGRGAANRLVRQGATLVAIGAVTVSAVLMVVVAAPAAMALAALSAPFSRAGRRGGWREAPAV